ncbi:MAG: hypothetical protein ACK50A_01870 [Sphingobacteriaceae bacterium]|jgi:predicted transcriptional regulator
MFSSEKDLVNKLKRNYSFMCYWNTTRSTTKILEEVDLGFGVADLVFSKVRPSAVTKNTSLSYFDITIYKIIQNSKEISFENIKNLTRADSSTLRKSLKKLVLESYIKEQDTLYKFKRTYKHCFEESIAIEAKLKNWKRALNQAYRYKWFASSSYVVLDSQNITGAVTNIEQFKKMNVGLACIDKKGSISILFKPKKEKPLDEKMQILLSEMFWT